MNNLELIKTFMKLVECANNKGADGLIICINAPDGGKIKCKFEYECELPGGYHEK